MTCPRYVCIQCGARGPKEEQEYHQANCNLRDLLKHGSVPKFQEANKVELSGSAERFQPLWETQSSSLFFIDTEYTRDLLVEICVMKADGEIIVNTIVDHSTQIQSLYDQSGNGIERSTVNKVCGDERDQNTSGMTLKQIAETLITTGFVSSSILVEWS